MKARLVRSLVKWATALACLGGLLAVGYVVRSRVDAERAAETGESVDAPRRAQNNVVKLGARLAESYGVKDVPAEPARWEAPVTVYGRVVPNPRAVTEVRAPFAGTLRPDADQPWPSLGSRVKAGQVLAWLDVRVSPEVRLDLLTRLKEARAKLGGAEEVVKIHQERVDRLEAAGGSVSRTDLDTARVHLAESRTQSAAARATVRQWEEALDEISRQGNGKEAAWSKPLKAPIAGEVTDLIGGANVAIEAGGLVTKLVDFDKVLARLDLPLSALSAGPPAKLELSALSPVPAALEGAGNRPEAEKPAALVPARLVGPAPQVDSNSQLAGFWYEVNASSTAGIPWRPGLFVRASVKTLGEEARPAVAVPESALLYHQGRALVYVRLSPGRFERREVQVLGRDGERWVLAGGVTAGEHVVHRRAQVLLSEEFRGDVDND
jgi:biotin carboxyl carrier protein